MRKFTILSIFLISAFSISGVLHAMPHPYTSGSQKFDGMYFPSAKKNAPGIVMIHNWMGVSSETEKQAMRFQKLGYNVLVADIYGAGVRPKDVKGAGELATKYKTDRKLFRSHIHAAIEDLKAQAGVNKSKIAVVGYCFGGTGAIEAARAGEDLKAVVSFHGGLDSPAPADGANIKARVLALHGADDPFVPAKDVEAFETEMKTNHVKYELVKYPGAVHSFTEMGAGSDNSKGAAYNASADQKSFAKAQAFLAAAFN
jgi:dienelactone hydrolase